MSLLTLIQPSQANIHPVWDFAEITYTHTHFSTACCNVCVRVCALNLLITWERTWMNNMLRVTTHTFPLQSIHPLIAHRFNTHMLATHSLSIIVSHPDKSPAAQAEILPPEFSTAINWLQGHLACTLPRAAAQWTVPWGMPPLLPVKTPQSRLASCFLSSAVFFWPPRCQIGKERFKWDRTWGVDFGFRLAGCLFWQASLKPLSPTTIFLCVCVALQCLLS